MVMAELAEPAAATNQALRGARVEAAWAPEPAAVIPSLIAAVVVAVATAVGVVVPRKEAPVQNHTPLRQAAGAPAAAPDRQERPSRPQVTVAARRPTAVMARLSSPCSDRYRSIRQLNRLFHSQR